MRKLVMEWSLIHFLFQVWATNDYKYEVLESNRGDWITRVGALNVTTLTELQSTECPDSSHEYLSAERLQPCVLQQ